MKIRFNTVLSTFICGLVELLLFFPVIFAADIIFIPPSLRWYWIGILPVFYIVAIGICFTPINRWKLVCYIASGIINGGIAFILFGLNLPMVMAVVIGLIILSRVIHHIKGWEGSLNQGFFITGLIIYFIAYFAYKYAPDWTGLKAFVPVITYTALASIATYLITTNIIKLKISSQSRDKKASLPSTLVRHNRITIAVNFVIICAIASVDRLSNGITWLLAVVFGSIFSAIKWIINAIMSLMTMEGDGLPMPTESPIPLPQEETSFSPVSDVFQVIGIIFLIGIIAIVLVVAIKALIRSMSAIRWNQRVFEEDSGGYEDEKENLASWGLLKKNSLDMLQKRISKLMEKELGWDDLTTNRERIRYIYLHYILRRMAKGYEFKRHLTPSETAADLARWSGQHEGEMEKIVLLYNQARYGDESGDGCLSQVDEMRDGLLS